MKTCILIIDSNTENYEVWFVHITATIVDIFFFHSILNLEEKRTQSKKGKKSIPSLRDLR